MAATRNAQISAATALLVAAASATAASSASGHYGNRKTTQRNTSSSSSSSASMVNRYRTMSLSTLASVSVRQPPARVTDSSLPELCRAYARWIRTKCVRFPAAASTAPLFRCVTVGGIVVSVNRGGGNSIA
jgi:hypothetical protein